MEGNQGNKVDPNSPRNSHHHGAERSEPVRSRWTPKPEQILILESIFNSGMVNPPKEETIRIRKLLEKFGSVGDANVFYWFQNRRSRSRRRQRQLQASLQGGGDQRVTGTSGTIPQVQVSSCGGGAIHPYMGGGGGSSDCYMSLGFSSSSTSFGVSSPPSYVYGSSSSSCGVGDENGVESLFPVSSQLGFQDMDHQGSSLSHPAYCSSSEATNLHYQNGGYITVYINGVATEFPRGPIDIRAMFGEDLLLVHSSGILLPTNEFGFLMQSLEHGESYFLVSRST